MINYELALLNFGSLRNNKCTLDSFGELKFSSSRPTLMLRVGAFTNLMNYCKRETYCLEGSCSTLLNYARYSIVYNCDLRIIGKDSVFISETTTDFIKIMLCCFEQ